MAGARSCSLLDSKRRSVVLLGMAASEPMKYRLVLEPTEAGQYLAFVQCRMPNSSVWECWSGKRPNYLADDMQDLLRIIEQELLRMVGV